MGPILAGDAGRPRRQRSIKQGRLGTHGHIGRDPPSLTYVADKGRCCTFRAKNLTRALLVGKAREGRYLEPESTQPFLGHWALMGQARFKAGPRLSIGVQVGFKFEGQGR